MRIRGRRVHTSAERGARSKRRFLWIVAVGLAVPVGLLVAVAGWTRVSTSPGFCVSCHDGQTAVVAAQRSVHSTVPCLSCHQGSGATAAISYLPTLVREAAEHLTGLPLARGVLPALPCASCHAPARSSALLRAGHPAEPSLCQTCHGDVAHPGGRLSAEGDHPPRYLELHGRDTTVVRAASVSGSPASCRRCHEVEFCASCHFRAPFPHPDQWTQTHGSVQLDQGAQACTLCHPPTFCKSCHATEIPHTDTWLGEHAPTLRDRSSEPCLTCHVKNDCASCHTQHRLHPEQSVDGRGDG